MKSSLSLSNLRTPLAPAKNPDTPLTAFVRSNFLENTGVESVGQLIRIKDNLSARITSVTFKNGCRMLISPETVRNGELVGPFELQLFAPQGGQIVISRDPKQLLRVAEPCQIKEWISQIAGLVPEPMQEVSMA